MYFPAEIGAGPGQEIVAAGGVVALEVEPRAACREWLGRGQRDDVRVARLFCDGDGDGGNRPCVARVIYGADGDEAALVAVGSFYVDLLSAARGVRERGEQRPRLLELRGRGRLRVREAHLVDGRAPSVAVVAGRSPRQ